MSAWQTAAKPSRTARKVAINILSLGSVKGMDQVLPANIVDATATLLVDSGVLSKAAVRFARSAAAVGIYRACDWLMPGQFEAFAYRKAFCELQVLEAIDAGAQQVLVLGCGYDTLCWRLSQRFRSVSFFEIDHPATMSLKVRGFEVMGVGDNHYLLSEDLGERQLIDVLGSHAAWNPERSTAIVAEGLLMYLSPLAVASLFEQCAACSGSDSRIAFTFIAKKADGHFDAGPCTSLLLWLLERGGEPWQWGIQPEQLNSFLRGHQWPVVFGQPYDGLTRHGIEHFAVAGK